MAVDWLGDFEVSGGDIVIASDREAFAQRCGMRVAVNQGEWAYDLSFGVPWYAKALGRSFPLIGLQEALTTALQADSETQTVGAITLTAQDTRRRAKVEISVRSVFGSESAVSRSL